MSHSIDKTPWASYNSPHPRVPRLTKIPVPVIDQAAITSSSVSSPSAPDSDCAAEVDELLEGIDRVRIDDLWTTPRADNITNQAAPFRAGLFAPPDKHNAFASISATVDTTSHQFHSSQHTFPRSKTVPVPDTPRLLRSVSATVNPLTDFPKLFKVYPCQNRDACLASGNTAECFYYHSVETDRRRGNVAIYKPHMCRFIEEATGCRKADRCPFSHNDFERRYHPDRFGKETCRDFLRGDCPRRYCTFRHEVSSKVEISLSQIEAMNDKELLQLVLKIDEQKGRALCEKLLRRFGHGKKHSGWKLEGFNPHGREDQKVKFVTARVEGVKQILKAAGEKKWASSLKTSSLRDMMSGVRKVAEEIRERCRRDENYVENGSEAHRLIRAVFSNTNWSCHSQEGDNPFLVTPENQNDAMTALEKLVKITVNQDKPVLAHAGDVASLDKEGASQASISSTESVKVKDECKLYANTDTDDEANVRLTAHDVVTRNGDGTLKADQKRERREVGTLWAHPASLGQLAV